MHVHGCIHVCVRACVYVHAWVYEHLAACVCMRANICVCMHACMYILHQVLKLASLALATSNIERLPTPMISTVIVDKGLV